MNSNSEPPKKCDKISSFEPATIMIGSVLAVLSGIICMQIMGKVGVSANTSVLGAVFAMLALGIGLLIRGYCQAVTGFDLGATNIPQGFMVGAGFVALVQSVISIYKSSSRKRTETEKAELEKGLTVTGAKTKKTLLAALFAHVAGGVFVGIICGVFTGMSPIKMVLWIVWTAFASVASMIIIGKAAMYSGWFPGFAVTTIFMTIGVLMGFGPIPVAVLTGYISAVGPCFADMGYDLKTGWIIRGKGEDQKREVYGRKQQVLIEMLGALIGIIVVIFFADMTLNDGLVPATSMVFATTAEMGSNLGLLKELLIFAIPGALVQIVGRKYMFGVLLATGLLINNPIYGIGVVVAVLLRKIIGDDFMNCRSAGLIAGDGLFGFFSSLIKMFVS